MLFRALRLTSLALLLLGCRSKRSPDVGEPAQERTVQLPDEGPGQSLKPVPPAPPPAQNSPVPPQPSPVPLPGEAPASDSVPPPQRWGTVSATADVTQQTPAPACRVRRVVPKFVGLAPADATERLNGRINAAVDDLQKALFSDSPCEGATNALPYGFDASYELGVQRGPYVALELSGTAYTGGAHPNGLVRCLVVSLGDGQLLQLNSFLTGRGRAELSALATERLAHEHGVTNLREAGFFVDELSIENPYGVCLSERGVRVQFQPYEVAPHALGLPAVEFSLKEVGELFDTRVAPELFQPGAR